VQWWCLGRAGSTNLTSLPAASNQKTLHILFKDLIKSLSNCPFQPSSHFFQLTRILPSNMIPMKSYAQTQNPKSEIGGKAITGKSFAGGDNVMNSAPSASPPASSLEPQPSLAQSNAATQQEPTPSGQARKRSPQLCCCELQEAVTTMASLDAVGFGVPTDADAIWIWSHFKVISFLFAAFSFRTDDLVSLDCVNSWTEIL